jgi:hypothetical protein
MYVDTNNVNPEGVRLVCRVVHANHPGGVLMVISMTTVVVVMLMMRL